MNAENAPDGHLMAPIEQLADLMGGRGGKVESIFASQGVTIFDNYPPFLFTGPGAAENWATRFFDTHPGYEELRHVFGPAQDFAIHGDRAYLSLPTTWTWRRAARSFHETGGWAFVLRREKDEWRIETSGWAVTSYRILE